MKYKISPIIVDAFQLGYDADPDWFIDHDKARNVTRHIGHDPIDYEVTIYVRNKYDRSSKMYSARKGNMIMNHPILGIFIMDKYEFDEIFKDINGDQT